MCIQCIRDTVVSSSSGMIQTSLMAEKTLSTVPTLASQVPMVSWWKKISSYPSSSFLFIVSQFLSTVLHHDKKSFKQSILQLMLCPSHSSRFFFRTIWMFYVGMLRLCWPWPSILMSPDSATVLVGHNHATLQLLNTHPWRWLWFLPGSVRKLWTHEKTLLTFHYTGWLIGILIMVHYI